MHLVHVGQVGPPVLDIAAPMLNAPWESSASLLSKAAWRRGAGRRPSRPAVRVRPDPGPRWHAW